MRSFTDDYWQASYGVNDNVVTSTRMIRSPIRRLQHKQIHHTHTNVWGTMLNMGFWHLGNMNTSYLVAIDKSPRACYCTQLRFGTSLVCQRKDYER